jgi:hypothetical protein
LDTSRRLMNALLLGSGRPFRRLVAYYIALAAVLLLLFQLVPNAGTMIKGDHNNTFSEKSQLLQTGLAAPNYKETVANANSATGIELALETLVIMLSTLSLMLPVSWVFMSVRRTKGFSQSIVQTLLILPIVVAGIVLVVRTSIALAFSLGGIVAGLRFRTTMRDVRDSVYIFLSIGIGLAAGVQSLIVAAVLSVMFNFAVLLAWRFDFGRNVPEPTASSQWAEPLGELSDRSPDDGVPDRDLVMALSPKRAAALAKRFNRVRRILGPTGRKPRFNAVLTVTSTTVSEAQAQIELVLNTLARRWRLDEVTTPHGKPSELYYLVGVRKNVTRDQFLTVISERAGGLILSAELELAGTAVNPAATEAKAVES